MRKLHLLLFLISVSGSFYAQELKLMKATKQTINAGAAPMSTTNYLIQFCKGKKGMWSVDSVVNVYTEKKVEYYIVKVDNPDAVSPDYKQVKSFGKKDKGIYQITFSARKKRGSGRPGTPMEEMVPVAEFTQGAIVYYRIGNKKYQLKVESFDELETINAP